MVQCLDVLDDLESPCAAGITKIVSMWINRVTSNLSSKYIVHFLKNEKIPRNKVVKLMSGVPMGVNREFELQYYTV